MRVVIDASAVDEVGTYLVRVPVTNSAEFELPVTGGRGTLLFTVIGLVLIGVALVIIVVVIRKKGSR